MYCRHVEVKVERDMYDPTRTRIRCVRCGQLVDGAEHFIGVPGARLRRVDQDSRVIYLTPEMARKAPQQGGTV